MNLYHAGTNGIYYQQVLIQIPNEIVQSPYFNLLSILMGEVGAGEYDYLELQQIQTAVSGGLVWELHYEAKLMIKIVSAHG